MDPKVSVPGRMHFGLTSVSHGRSPHSCKGHKLLKFASAKIEYCLLVRACFNHNPQALSSDLLTFLKLSKISFMILIGLSALTNSSNGATFSDNLGMHFQ